MNSKERRRKASLNFPFKQKMLEFESTHSTSQLSSVYNIGKRSHMIKSTRDSEKGSLVGSFNLNNS
jgi:hypothetical protein